MKTILLHRSEDGGKIAVLDGNNKEVSHISTSQTISNFVNGSFDDFFENSQEHLNMPDNLKHFFDTHAPFANQSNIVDTLLNKLDISVQKVIIDGEDLYREVMNTLSQQAPQYLTLIELHDEPTDLFKKYDAILPTHVMDTSYSNMFQNTQRNSSINEFISLDNTRQYQTNNDSTQRIIDAEPTTTSEPKTHNVLTRSRPQKSPIEMGTKQSPVTLIIILMFIVICLVVAISVFTK
ncbi:MAG: hypothetical protein KGV50_05660 [Gammaproteobacteria bacterium]|nr:hypothetical protein [Gammaproteobacteria bacterium]